MTRLTQTVQQMVTLQQQPAPAGAVNALNPPEDSNFQWTALRSPLDATFPLPATGVVQRIAAGLFVKIQANVLTSRDLHEARFAVDMMADWEEMDEELRMVFQRVNLYAIVATHGWPTAIAATTATTNALTCFLPPGLQPIVQQPRQKQQRGQQQQGGGRQRNRQPAAATAPVQAPAPLQLRHNVGDEISYAYF